MSCLVSLLLLSETWKEPKERISVSKGCEWWVETAEGETIRRILIAIDTTILRGSCLTKRIKLFSVILKHLSLSVCCCCWLGSTPAWGVRNHLWNVSLSDTCFWGRTICSEYDTLLCLLISCVSLILEREWRQRQHHLCIPIYFYLLDRLWHKLIMLRWIINSQRVPGQNSTQFAIPKEFMLQLTYVHREYSHAPHKHLTGTTSTQ